MSGNKDEKFLKNFETAKTLIEKSGRVTAFTGAGASTLSGLPDFRGKNGLYKSMDADKIFDIDYFTKDPSYYYKNTKGLIYNLDAVKPNIVHSTLAALEKSGKCGSVITQNIDMLHQRAGSSKVIELHGSPEPHFCMRCGRKYPFAAIVETLKTTDVPYCADCKGLIKPDIIFFGEPLKQEAMMDAYREVQSSDLMLVLGSSLVVWPAAGIPQEAAREGKKVIIVNDQPTSLDGYASAVFDDLQLFFEEFRI